MITPEEDAEIERIMGLSEEELYAEIRAEGGDPDEYVRRFDEVLQRAKAKAAVRKRCQRIHWTCTGASEPCPECAPE